LQALKAARQRNNSLVLNDAQKNVEAARRRLQLWDVSDAQIDGLARSGKVRKSLTFYSPCSGIVVRKNAFEGAYAPAGRLLYRVADLSKVWVYLFAYQNQIHCVYLGQGATLRLPNLPGRTFEGKVIYIYPYLDPKNRAVKVRLEFDNPHLLLKPGMYADVRLEPHRMGIGIKIPQSAILQTGQRSLVYLSEPGNKFRAREITTGMESDGGMMIVLSGLEAGQRIVAAPSFLMDSESRLRAVDLRFGPAPDWMKLVPPRPMPGMKMPGMKMPGMQPRKPMPGMDHKRPMTGREGGRK
jgi:RND family efflux transporter MFP subunit